MAERVFLLPDPGEGLVEADVLAWLVAEGDVVELNQPLVEVETAKAAVEIPSPFAGRVVALHAAAGASVAVGAPLVTFDVGGGFEEHFAGDGLEEHFAGGAARSHGSGGDGSQIPEGSTRGAEPPAARPSTPAAGAVSTPAVRALARRLGVDIASVAGTGSGGRATDGDVRAAADGDGPSITAPFDDVRVTAVRRVIAERLTAVVRETPLVTTFRTVDCSSLEAVRGELGVSPLPVVLRALAETCVDHPMLNAAWVDEGPSIRVYRRVDAGVGIDTERGLTVAVVRDVGSRGIGDLAGEIGRLADAARAGALASHEVTGSTIIVSNTGSYGSEAGTPIPEPGVAVVLAIGVIAPRALVVDGGVVARPACTLSLTFDHRVLDGAAAGRALTDLVALLQDGARLRDLPR
jgi:2-oxoisovalerate dehydrogenase E2 component (dihydrolipoyl transacylase)